MPQQCDEEYKGRAGGRLEPSLFNSFQGLFSRKECNKGLCDTGGKRLLITRGIPSARFPLGPFCNQAAQAASVDFSGKGPKREQGGKK